MARYRPRDHCVRTVTAWLLVLLGLAVPARAGTHPTHSSAAKSFRPELLWSRPLKKGRDLGRGLYQFTQPILHDGTLYVGSATAGVFALTTDGKQQWMAATEGPVYAPVRVEGDTVFAADSEGSVYALDRATGERRWHTSITGEIMARPLMVAQTLYIVTTSGQLFALDRTTGIPRWHTNERLVITEFSVRGCADPLLHQGRIVIGYADGRLAAHSLQNGDLLWEERIARRIAPLQDVDATPVALGDRLITASIGNGLAAIDGRNGQLHWFEPIGSPNSVTTAGEMVYVASNGTVMAVHAQTGEIAWRRELPEVSETSAPALVGETVVVFATDGPLFLLDRHTGTLVGSHTVGQGTFGRATVDGDRVYVVTNGHRVLALRMP